MKKQLIPFLKTYLFLMISYLLISFILAVFCTFIHLSSFLYELIIHIFSYVILLISCLFLFKMVKQKPLLYAAIYALSYMIISIAITFSFDFWMVIKPLLIIAVFCILFYLKKNNDD